MILLESINFLHSKMPSSVLLERSYFMGYNCRKRQQPASCDLPGLDWSNGDGGDVGWTMEIKTGEPQVQYCIGRISGTEFSRSRTLSQWG